MLNGFWWTIPMVLNTLSTSSLLIPVLVGIGACAYVFPANHARVWRWGAEGKEMVSHFITGCYFWLLLEEFLP